MTDLPFLMFREPDERGRRDGGRRFTPPRMARPGREGQRRRFGPRFTRLRDRLDTPAGLAELHGDPASIAPDRAIVLEIAELHAEKAYTAFRNAGLELLGDDEAELPPDENFALLDDAGERKEKALSARLYFAMPSVASLQQLCSLWERYDRGERLERPFTAWNDVFEHLADVRPWGPQDRLPPETISAWQDDLEADAATPVTIEVELWYRRDPALRQAAADTLRDGVRRAGGRVLDERQISEIAYHAALVELEAAQVRAMIADPMAGLVAVDEVMFLRPQTLAAEPIVETEAADAMEEATVQPVAEAPIAALFDGVPVAGHQLLAGRLTVDDPDDLAAAYEHASQQQHGTGMASIMLHGDANGPLTTVRQRLYVRPVLEARGGNELFPEGMLAVYRIYRAFMEMLVGTDDMPAAAPNVRIVNLSLGDPHRRFAGILSPWAKLLDYMAFRYRLLIVVSAGNILDPLEIRGVQGFAELEDAEDEQRSQLVLDALIAQRAHRAILAPAEAVNVVTVGARHADIVANGRAPNSVDPFADSDLANVSSAVGMGAGRSAKPDILVDGGREMLRPIRSGDGMAVVEPMRVPGRFFGIGVATAGVRGELDRRMNMSGTSPAAALASHEALRIFEAIEAMDGVHVPDESIGVVLKSLLAHGAAWNVDVSSLLDDRLREAGYRAWQHRRHERTRFLGHGVPRFGRVLGCTNQRALVLAFGDIRADEKIPYQLPIPMGLSKVEEWRGVAATLAWLTPVNFAHQRYRMAELSVKPAGNDRNLAMGVDKEKDQPDDNTVQRGTIVHRRWSGSEQIELVDNQGLQFEVSCREGAGRLDEAVPFALAVTIEVAEDSEIEVYEEVRARIGTPVVVRP